MLLSPLLPERTEPFCCRSSPSAPFSFLHGPWDASHPAHSYFWMLLLSPQWKLKLISPNAAHTVHPWAQHSCSVPLSPIEGGEDPAPPSPVNDFRLLSWTESHSAIREGSLIDPQRGFPSTYTWCHPEGGCWSTPRCSPLAEAHFALPHTAMQ